MGEDDPKRLILARPARFVAAAMASAPKGSGSPEF